MCAKISILLFYLQLWSHTSFKFAIYGILAVSITCSLVGAFDFLFKCQPIAKYWDRSITYGSCIDQTYVWVGTAAVNSVTDIVMVLLPILMLWNTHFPIRQKIAIIAILMTGVL